MDLGCGSGHFLVSAKNKTKHSIGVDMNRAALCECKTAGSDVVRCNIFALPFKDEIFDGIFFSHVIEHIPVQFVQNLFVEINRVLNGKLMIVTPTEHSKFWTEGHVIAYSKTSLSIVLNQNGYNVSEICYDKCLLLGIKDHKFLLAFFNMLPFLWLKMNIIAIANRS